MDFSRCDYAIQDSQTTHSVELPSDHFDIPQASSDGLGNFDIEDGTPSSAGPSECPHSPLGSASASAPPLAYENYMDGIVESGYVDQLFVDQICHQPMAGWNAAANHFSGVVTFEDMEQPSRLWAGDNCTPKSISRERQFDNRGPHDFFREGEFTNTAGFDPHTEAEYSTSSGMVTARYNTEWDTIGQSEGPSSPEGMEEMAVWKGKQRAEAPSPPSRPPLEDAVAHVEPPTGSIRRWKEPTVAYPRVSMDYPLGSSRHKGLEFAQLCDWSVLTARQQYFGWGNRAGWGLGHRKSTYLLADGNISAQM